MPKLKKPKLLDIPLRKLKKEHSEADSNLEKKFQAITIKWLERIVQYSGHFKES